MYILGNSFNGVHPASLESDDENTYSPRDLMSSGTEAAEKIHQKVYQGVPGYQLVYLC